MRAQPGPGVAALLLALLGHGTHAAGIDLDCETRSRQTLERLDAAGLLNRDEPDRQRALAVILEQCRGTEATARQQHETGKQEALDNWFFEQHTEKEGNRRLQRLKR
ncbi:MAG: hypothetical protein R3F42_08675 [Pseudomonadota bacterium]